jgi:hypothetical protein
MTVDYSKRASGRAYQRCSCLVNINAIFDGLELSLLKSEPINYRWTPHGQLVNPNNTPARRVNTGKLGPTLIQAVRAPTQTGHAVMFQLFSTNLTVELLRRTRRLEGLEEYATLQSTMSNLERRWGDSNEVLPFSAVFVDISDARCAIQDCPMSVTRCRNLDAGQKEGHSGMALKQL